MKCCPVHLFDCHLLMTDDESFILYSVSIVCRHHHHNNMNWSFVLYNVPDDEKNVLSCISLDLKIWFLHVFCHASFQIQTNNSISPEREGRFSSYSQLWSFLKVITQTFIIISHQRRWGNLSSPSTSKDSRQKNSKRIEGNEMMRSSPFNNLARIIPSERIIGVRFWSKRQICLKIQGKLQHKRKERWEWIQDTLEEAKLTCSVIP